MPTSGAEQSTEWVCGAESIIIASDKPGNHRRLANVMVATGYTRGYEADSIEEIVRKNGLFLPGYNMPEKAEADRRTKPE